ncbi:MAG: hypothetical protein BAJALOKI3v1_190020 [Promethearchaeota archaeon]|nr:MAG: hypothetical protein BAJALOKI3v1_190020 [Candidatus Lokiarchaeota archaeon]
MYIPIPSLNLITFSILILIIFVFYTLFLVIMYRKFKGLFSGKYILGIIAEYISLKIEEFNSRTELKPFDNMISKIKLNILPNK